MIELSKFQVTQLLHGVDVALPTRDTVPVAEDVSELYPINSFWEDVGRAHLGVTAYYAAYGDFLKRDYNEAFDRTLEKPGLRARATDYLIREQHQNGMSLVSRVIFDDPAQHRNGWIVDAIANKYAGVIIRPTITTRFTPRELTIYEHEITATILNFNRADSDESSLLHGLVKSRTEVMHDIASAYLAAWDHYEAYNIL